MCIRDRRKTGPYLASQFVGGMPPAVFLFLLGVTFAFGMDGQERKGADSRGRFIAALKRAGQILSLIHISLSCVSGSTKNTTQPPPPAPQTFAPLLPARRASVTRRSISSVVILGMFLRR